MDAHSGVNRGAGALRSPSASYHLHGQRPAVTPLTSKLDRCVIEERLPTLRYSMKAEEMSEGPKGHHFCPPILIAPASALLGEAAHFPDHPRPHSLVQLRQEPRL